MYEGIVQDLIDELGRLPGVGPKGAQRIAFHLLQADPLDVRRLADVRVEVKARVKFCTTCFNVAEDDQCRICRDPRRDAAVLCVVEEYKDVVAIERTREFRGRYHVLGGAISPIEGVGPDGLRGRELMGGLQGGARAPARSRVPGVAIRPIEGVGPDDLRVRELMVRLQDGSVTELILATDPNLQGAATATHPARPFAPMGARPTR